MNAGTAHITTMSPFFVRTSFSMWHAGFALGEAAAKQLKAKTAVVGYSDFPPGKDSLAAFKRAFEASGGKVVDEIPMGGPAQVPDFTPFFQRAKDKKPDVFFVFVPAGDHALAVVKTYGALAAIVILLTWIYLTVSVVVLGAELNAELEHQTRVDSTVGRPKPMGQRGARMADTVGESR